MEPTSFFTMKRVLIAVGAVAALVAVVYGGVKFFGKKKEDKKEDKKVKSA